MVMLQLLQNPVFLGFVVVVMMHGYFTLLDLYREVRHLDQKLDIMREQMDNYYKKQGEKL